MPPVVGIDGQTHHADILHGGGLCAVNLDKVQKRLGSVTPGCRAVFEIYRGPGTHEVKIVGVQPDGVGDDIWFFGWGNEYLPAPGFGCGGNGFADGWAVISLPVGLGPVGGDVKNLYLWLGLVGGRFRFLWLTGVLTARRHQGQGQDH